MPKNNYWLLISILTLLSALGTTGGSSLAAPAVNVGLTRFEAIPLDNAVRLEWDTETELETAGFMLKRGQNNSFDYLADPAGTGTLFIVSEGGPAFGFNYVFVDETVINGEIYTYKLIEVEVNGSEVVHAESTVTVGLVPTNTPIELGSGGGNGSNNNPPPATTTATLQATAVASPTSETSNTAVVSATPFPTSVPVVAATKVVPEEVSPDFATEPPTANDDQQKVSEQPAIDTTDQSEETTNSGVAVAFAQEDPQDYPAVETIEEAPGELISDEEVDATNELQGSTVTSDRPEVIGAPQYPADESPSGSETQVQDTETAAPSSGLAGKAYLWVAFIAALVIFAAAVLGAILLYTRQRSKE